MTQTTVYIATRNCGDGSCAVDFFECGECIDLLEEADPETYGCSEGGSPLTFEGKLLNVDIYTLEQVKTAIQEMEDSGSGYVYLP